MTDPTNLLGVIAIAAAFLALAGIATYWDHRRHPKTPAPTRQAAQGPRVGVGTKRCTACGAPATRPIRAGYDTWDFCTRCREEYDALTGRAW